MRCIAVCFRIDFSACIYTCVYILCITVGIVRSRLKDTIYYYIYRYYVSYIYTETLPRYISQPEDIISRIRGRIFIIFDDTQEDREQIDRERESSSDSINQGRSIGKSNHASMMKNIPINFLPDNVSRSRVIARYI